MGSSERLRIRLDTYGACFCRMGSLQGWQMGVDRRRLCMGLLRTVGVGPLSLWEMGFYFCDRMVLGSTCKRRCLLGTRICRLGSYAYLCLMGSAGSRGNILWPWPLWSPQCKYHPGQHQTDPRPKNCLQEYPCPQFGNRRSPRYLC